MLLEFWSRYRPLVLATVVVGLSMAGLWVKWCWLQFDSSGWPEEYRWVMAGLFAAGVMYAFGAAAVASPRGRRALQVVAVICLGGMLLLPIDVNRWLPAPVFKYRRDDQLVKVRSKPVIEHRAGTDVVVLTLAGIADAPIRLYIGRELATKLSADHVMEFSFWQTRDVLLPGWRVKGEVPRWEQTLETVRDGDHLLYDARICPIHHVMMQRMELPIYYGLPDYDATWAEFSGGPGFIEGGCVIGPRQTAMGYRCPLCAARYAKWVAEIRRRPNRN